MADLSCPDVRVFSTGPVDLSTDAVKEKIGMIDFTSYTISAFKIESLEDRFEDYGQVATYMGTVAECPHELVLDDHHSFKTGKPMLICGNTASMLQETRLSKHFEVSGDRSQHFGLFDCEPTIDLHSKKNSGDCC